MEHRHIYSLFAFVMLILVSGCGNSGKEQQGGQADAAAAEEKAKATYGKITEVSMDAQLNAEYAEKGEKIFNVVCSACHKLDERYVGPELGTVFKRRTPVYIMNMMLDTEVMLEKDDTARCLLQEYLTKMPSAQVNETDARFVLEHLRAVAETR